MVDGRGLFFIAEYGRLGFNAILVFFAVVGSMKWNSSQWVGAELPLPVVAQEAL